MLFRFENVAKEFGGTTVFSGVTVQANRAEHIGLIGHNGCGKTTLLQLAAGELEPDLGTVHRVSELRISQILQNPVIDPNLSLRQSSLLALDYLNQMEKRLRTLESDMAKSPGSVFPSLASEYENLKVRFEMEGGYDRQSRAESALHGLGFDAEELTQKCGELSGGQMSRLALAQAVLQPADLMLLDEPTNHLDLKGVLWLSEYLKKLKSTFIVVSHDRRFLDRITSTTWELEGGRLCSYAGNFSKARMLKREAAEREEKEYKRQKAWRTRTEDFVRRNIAGQKTRQAQSRLKKLEKTQRVERPVFKAQGPVISIQEAGRGAAVSLRLKKATFGYESCELVKDVSLDIRRGERIAVLGANGSGKSTFLRTVVGELQPLGGSIEWGRNCVPAYFSQNPDLGPPDRTVHECLRDLDNLCTDEAIRSFAARFLFKGEDIFKKVGRLSGGEGSRLALARLLFHPANVLLLDEPTNHLDIRGREALEEALENYGGTLLVVSHDLYFVERVANRMLLIDSRNLVEAGSVPEVLELVSGSRPSARLDRRGKGLARERTGGGEASKPSLSKNERMRLRQRLTELESRIARLETEKTEVLQALTGNSDHNLLMRLSLRHEALEEELSSLYQSWELAFEELGS